MYHNFCIHSSVNGHLGASMSCCCCCVALVVSDSVRPHKRQPTRLPRPWDSPGKNTGVGCHFLLQCMKVKSESEVAQSCLTLAAFQAPPSMGFSRQEYWSGCHCPLLGIVNSAATLRYKNLLQLWFSQGICPVVGLLGHMVVLFLVFKGISILFSIVAVSICIPTNTARRFLFLHVLSSIYCL